MPCVGRCCGLCLVFFWGRGDGSTRPFAPLTLLPVHRPLPPPFVAVQKWNKGKVREKLANAVLFDEKTYERLVAEVPKVRSLGPHNPKCPAAGGDMPPSHQLRQW